MGVTSTSIRAPLILSEFVIILGAVILRLGCSDARPATTPAVTPPLVAPVKRPRGLEPPKIPLAVSAEPREELAPGPEAAVQSDMMLTADQLAALFTEEGGDGQTEGRGRRGRRKAMADVTRLWPRGIVPYEISISSSSDRGVIEDAIFHWEERTCLDFQPYNRRTARLLRHTSKLVFIKGTGCWSMVGRSSSGAQDISIGEGCAVLGSVVHEIGHAIGFFHEHSRPDRAEHIRVHTENVAPRYRHDFRAMDWGRVTTVGVPYDTKSIMHYGSHYQSMNGEATITTIDPLQQANLGRRDGLSFGDVKLANIIYQCNAHCDTASAEHQCLNGGYMGPSCTCVCPDEYTGNNCSTVTPKRPGCVALLTDAQGEVSSPNFPSAYGNNMHCIWHIKGNENTTIEVTMNLFAMEGGDACPYDYIQYLQSDMRPFQQRYCGGSPPSPTTVFPTNEVVIEFQSDDSITASGFQFTYQLILPTQGNDTTFTPV